MNFFKKCECISRCYLPISSIFLELLPTGLLKYVWPFVTTQHEWANNFLDFGKKINEKVGKLV